MRPELQPPPTDHRPAGPPAGPVTMTAAVRHRYGSADAVSIEVVDRPSPGPGQVLIAVGAAGLDRGVWHLLTGLPYLVRLAGFGVRRPKNPVLGLDVAGTVAEVGPGVSRFAPGDVVFGFADGSFAEHAVASEDKLAPVPEGVTVEEAAVTAVSGSTALQALTDVGRIEAGQSVLIIGASGGVGTFAVQLAKASGATVTAVASTPKLDLVASLGADRVVDYTRQDPTGEGIRYDLIVDIGGRTPIRRLRSSLARHGTLVIVGGEGGDRLTGGIGRQLRALLLSPFVGQRLTAFISTEHHSVLDRLAAHLRRGELRPVIGERASLAEVPGAIRRLEAGDARGKTVVVVGPGNDGEGAGRDA